MSLKDRKDFIGKLARYQERRRFAQIATEIVTKVRPYTMVRSSGVRFLIYAVKQMLDQGVPGDFIECGVWKGGCAAAMLLAQHALLDGAAPRFVHLFDSYEGLKPAQPVDGQRALKWQANTQAPGYENNCAASLDLVRNNLAAVGVLSESSIFHQGWFDQTLPRFVQDRTGLQIALLRLDGDWYESTKVCLENLYDRVAPGGIVIIDDYYHWDGCAVAIHEFLGGRKLSHRLRSLPDFSSAYFYKQTG